MSELKTDNHVMLRKNAAGCFGSYLDHVDRLSRPRAYFKDRHGWLDPFTHLIMTRTELVRVAPKEMKHFLGKVVIVSQLLGVENALDQLVQSGYARAPDLLAENEFINTIRPNPLLDSSIRRYVVRPETTIGLEALMGGVPIHPDFDYILNRALTR